LDEIEKVVELAHSGRMKGKGIIIVDKEQVAMERELGATV
jgi:propanol-preferring alcohol dehydrogenase